MPNLYLIFILFLCILYKSGSVARIPATPGHGFMQFPIPLSGIILQNNFALAFNPCYDKEADSCRQSVWLSALPGADVKNAGKTGACRSEQAKDKG